MDYEDADDLISSGGSATQCPYCGQWFDSIEGPPCPLCDGKG